MSRRRKEPSWSGLALGLLIFAFVIAVSQDWLGARDLYMGAATWVGEWMAGNVTDGFPAPTATPVAPAP